MSKEVYSNNDTYYYICIKIRVCMVTNVLHYCIIFTYIYIDKRINFPEHKYSE